MNRYICFLSTLILICPSIFANEDKLPPSKEIYQMMKSYNRNNGETGELIAYIPIERPCLNVISKQGHEEFCVFNIPESLATTNKKMAGISLTKVYKEYVAFDFNNIWYSAHCRYDVGSEQPICDEPYTD